MQRRMEWCRVMQRSLAAGRGHQIIGKDSFTHRNESFILLECSTHHTTGQLTWEDTFAVGGSRTQFFRACSDFMFGCLSPLHEVTPLDPACLAWTDEILLRCGNDDSSQNLSIWIGAASSMPDARLDNGLAPLLSVSSAQANAGSDSQDTSFSHHSLGLCVQCPSR